MQYATASVLYLAGEYLRFDADVSSSNNHQVEPVNLRRCEMEQNQSKNHSHEDTKKLSFVVVFLFLFVIAIFGLAPMV
jgi:hypothetical protein